MDYMLLMIISCSSLLDSETPSNPVKTAPSVHELPNAPTQPAKVNATRSSIHIRWASPSPNGRAPPVVGYRVEYFSLDQNTGGSHDGDEDAVTIVTMVLGQLPTMDNSPSDKNKPQPLPTGTMIPRTIPHQNNSPLGPLPQNKTTHQDQYLHVHVYGGELSWWGVVRIRFTMIGMINIFTRNFIPLPLCW